MKASAEQKQKILNRLKRSEGQIRGVQKMIEEDQECLAIVTQLSAIRSSIDRIMGVIVAENLKSCLENPDQDASQQTEKIEQALNLIIKK
ncbi:metal-sensitive transcriptional regulator [Vaginisenegalia massiliensis]|uniref:metal-sensitive transcriptional regulator n=1 Tax=Vaginisenegalia massiliensis TaxID=2058294 RepID=UPI000F54342B|nr:metal-sensitive transcriptional regulator [Vaginisenegalia massiliensis]